jgi:hypothetical protein
VHFLSVYYWYREAGENRMAFKTSHHIVNKSSLFVLNWICVNFQCSSPDGIFMSRHAALRAGIPIDRPAVTVNRLCGSGFQAIVSGAQASKEIQEPQTGLTLLLVSSTLHSQLFFEYRI